MYRKLKEIWEGSDFAVENLSFRESVGLILEKYGYPRDAFLKGVEVSPKDFEGIREDFEAAARGEVLGYILGRVPFYEEEYEVEEGVLCPRCDSEVLVSTAIEQIPENTRFLDMCTGSGCIGISVLTHRPDLRATLCDIGDTPLSLAERNAALNGVTDRCRVRRFDFLREDVGELGEFSALIMNPPYITEAEMKTLPENVKREPDLALFGGEDGLDFYRRAASMESLYGKTLIFEIGRDQGEALKELFSGGEVLRDISGNDRVFLVNYKK